MKLPRFHLGTMFIAVLLLSAFIGANFYVRKAEQFHFSRTGRHFGSSIDELVRYHYCRTRVHIVGWPCTASRYVASMPTSTVIYDPTSDQELREFQALKDSIYDREWDSASFQNLAPTIYRNFPPLPESDLTFSSPIWLFKEHANWDYATRAIAINAAVGFAITLAIAAACEFFIRRKRKRHPPGSALVIRT